MLGIMQGELSFGVRKLKFFFPYLLRLAQVKKEELLLSLVTSPQLWLMIPTWEELNKILYMKAHSRGSKKMC